MRTLSIGDVSDAVIHVPCNGEERTKHHEREIPLGALGQNVVGRLAGTRPPAAPVVCMGDRALTSQLNVWLQPVWTPHDLRRAFISMLEAMECPDYVIRDLVGHSRGPVRAVYATKIGNGQARTWMERVDAAYREALSESAKHLLHR